MRKMMLLLALCSFGCEQDKATTQVPTTPASTVLALELIDVTHSGHVYVCDIVHGHFIHSPACPFDIPTGR
jgi:hypothetical protein